VRPRPVIAATLVTLGLAAACGSSSDGGATSKVTTTPPTTAASTTATTAPTTTATTAPAPSEPTLFFPEARAAVDHLIDAWKRADAAIALQGATTRAVLNLFTQPAEGFSLYGCDSAEFMTSHCNYRNRATGGYAAITAEKRAQGWIVSDVAMSTDG